MKEFWTGTLTIVGKDILSELRAKDIFVSILVFALLVVVILNFAFEPEPERTGTVASGVLWVALSFAGVLGLNRSFALEKDTGCLEGLTLCPVDSEVIYLGKMVGCLIFMLIVEAVILPVFCFLFNLPLFLPRLALIAVLATIGFIAVGTLFSALTANIRAREIMLPILFLPVVSPVIIAAVKASGLVLNAEPWSRLSTWLGIIVAFDVIFLTVSLLLFHIILEE